MSRQKNVNQIQHLQPIYVQVIIHIWRCRNYWAGLTAVRHRPTANLRVLRASISGQPWIATIGLSDVLAVSGPTAAERSDKGTGVHLAQGEMENIPFDIGCDVYRVACKKYCLSCGRPQVAGLKTPQSVDVLSLDWLIYLHCGKLQWYL